MKATAVKYIYSSIIPLFFLLLFSGCSSFGPTKPNLPFAGYDCPSVLADLAQKDAQLVQELGRLPEFQDGISPSESLTLKSFINLTS
jgi:hypothetical protein